MTSLDEATRHHLRGRARAAAAHAIGVGAMPPRSPATLAADGTWSGVFVTLRAGDQLRGCIGCLDSGLTLLEAVERCAIGAALSDPRFPPVLPAEWPDLTLEVSVLGPFREIRDISALTIGRHGLLIEKHGRRGLLLPQVAIEWSWTAEELAAQTCVKAGLGPDAWKNGARLFSFEAEVF